MKLSSLLVPAIGLLLILVLFTQFDLLIQKLSWVALISVCIGAVLFLLRLHVDKDPTDDSQGKG